MSIKKFYPTAQELTKLLRMNVGQPGPITLEFGPGWTSLEWDTDSPMPPVVRNLLMLRGVLNENCDGAGI
jgi:hypothetical protein